MLISYPSLTSEWQFFLSLILLWLWIVSIGLAQIFSWCRVEKIKLANGVCSCYYENITNKPIFKVKCMFTSAGSEGIHVHIILFVYFGSILLLSYSFANLHVRPTKNADKIYLSVLSMRCFFFFISILYFCKCLFFQF